MATAFISSLCRPSIRPEFCNLTPQKSLIVTNCRRQIVLCSKKTDGDENLLYRFSIEEQSRTGNKRREAIFQFMIGALSFPSLVAAASAAENDVQGDFRIYSDDVNKFNILIPKDWQVGAGEDNGFRSVTAFYPEEVYSSNVSVVITGLGADFTRLESFGTVDAFAENLVNGLDRSWQRPPGLAAKLINSKAANGLYYIEYSLQNPGESCRHIFSAIGMASNGWYNRLYTVTGQWHNLA
ncbi:PREDICTED: psbP domain-containing protein 3, chloroplastic isoform X2 [Nelumbo nucifera]|uniref:PsbP domain-containing protein 3, chloroplastic isoform X2 n=1 Tax=Nelumbo nucifera TaxID=4432 RepID=A0A1U8B492_NELNU|nr:PREDICTED: psbP domain-containing protein 3, chloroplastic isoform X2 [Nelumbo nucifera]